MAKTKSEKKLAQNEVVFKEANKKVYEGLEKLQKSGSKSYISVIKDGLSIPLHFLCECSDEKCIQRIVISPNKFKNLHATPTRFVILPGHEVKTIERIITKNKKYEVVEKFEQPKPNPKKLFRTNLNNHKQK